MNEIFIHPYDEASAEIIDMVEKLKQGYLDDIGGVVQILPAIEITDEDILDAEAYAHQQISSGLKPDIITEIHIITGQQNAPLEKAA